MNEKLLAGLNESRRDALVPYYLKHVIPLRGLDALASKITTAEDLYEYLLLDPNVSGQIKTSRIAEAVASAQLYLHRCREQLEPNLDLPAMQQASNETGFFSRWNAYNKRYASWAGLQRLMYYPASYIDPELRYSKTQLFEELETAINQGRITDERVEQAFTQYVSGLRKVLDIRYDSGYQVEPASSKGEAYFLGSIPGTPGEYYWRRVDKTDHGTNAKVRNIASWSQWLKIDAPLQPMPNTVPSIVYFANRLHVVCVHEYSAGGTATDNDGVTEAQATMVQELQIATLKPSGQWSLRAWPLTNNPSKVFAAELRRAAPTTIEPELGVFVETPTGISLYRFSKLLQMIDSSGTALALNFVYKNVLFGDYYDIPVRQPLNFTPGIPAAVLSATSTYVYDVSNTFDSWYFGGVKLTSAGGKLRIAIDARTSHRNKIFNVRIFKAGVVFYSQSCAMAEVVNTYVMNTALLFADFVRDHSYVLEIALTTYHAIIPVERSAPGQPAIIINDNSLAHLWIPTAFDSAGHTQMLYTKPGNHKEWVLTTLAGPLLEQKMLVGVDALLSWDVQQMFIDPAGYEGATINRKISFEGGVGLYTWELFFHAPFLIANRLLAEQRFDEADRWFRRLFDPAGYRNAAGVLQMISGKPRYCNVRPLQEDLTWGPSSPVDTDDPDVIATADPMNYKLAVFLRELELLAARGDQLYRQQTRDSLSEAKMWYVHALQLLGKRPELPLALAWNAPTLEAASSASNLRLLELEQWVEEESALLPPASTRQIMVANGPFRPPVDSAVLAYWDRFEGRLYNLRRHLSIDGQPLALELFETPVDPKALQLARLAGDGAGGMQAGGAPVLWPQRFMVLLERARNAVQQVIQFGANLQGVLERRDADALNVLQQTQQGGLLALMGEAHGANLAALRHTLSGLQGTQAATLARQQHYDVLFSENISASEQRAMDLRSEAVFLETTSGVLRLTAGGLNLLPNVAGMAVGWGEVGGLVDAFSDVLRLTSNAKQGEAVKLDSSEQYRRRLQEWDLQRDQARREGELITTQIAALNEQIAMAEKQRQQTEMEQAYNDAVLEVLNTRFTGQALFNWQAARMSTLYYQLYDTVSSLCTQAQTSLRWETQDTRNYLRPGNWSDLYQGLLAGESQLLSLQQMEAAYLSWDQRALQVRKTASLRTLDPQLIDTIRQLVTPDSLAVVDRIKTELPVEAVVDSDNNLVVTFKLQSLSILDDYPASLNLGSRRLIKSLSISLPALLGPYENVQAVLRYNSAHQLASGCSAVALSHGLDDSGQFMLDFNDGQYLPFEGLPVDQGEFSLVFPHARGGQQAMLLSLNDIILHVSYTIR
ncbi:neuraminidase-like domain-containing protein [Pseudomonas psychrophila]|uniref:Tc toxin subunit A-related protein n=1 Tax=Pseudomonas psychrophila TaxID=122355 RepID=UPI003818F016